MPASAQSNSSYRHAFAAASPVARAFATHTTSPNECQSRASLKSDYRFRHINFRKSRTWALNFRSVSAVKKHNQTKRKETK